MALKFYTRKRRAPVVIIVSLIDILSILLIFFIVTTTFRQNSPQLKIALPESRSAEAGDKKEKLLMLEVENEHTIRLAGRPVTLDGLPAALREVEQSDPGRGVALQADENVPYRVIVRLFDAIREAGIKNLPAFTRPAGGSKP